MSQSKHSAAAELHFYAAYEHWVAEYWEKQGNPTNVRRSARRALQHSISAGALSREALAAEAVKAIRGPGQSQDAKVLPNRTAAFQKICNAIAEGDSQSAVA